jgi:hypothetical protein
MLIGWLCFSFSVRAACVENLSAGMHLENFRLTLRPRQEICINISAFTYDLAFEAFPPDLTIYEYRSEDNSSDLTRREVIHIQDLPTPYRVIPSAFASQTLSTTTGGSVSFAYGSLPGLCQTGIFFSNRISEHSFPFSHDSAPPLDIGFNDDKCIVFLSQGEHSVHIHMKTEECCDKLFNYCNGLSTIEAYSGTFAQNLLIIDAEDEPSIFRFVSDSKVVSNSFSVGIDSSGNATSFGYTAFFDPLNLTHVVYPSGDCDLLPWLTWTFVAIAAGAVVALVLLGSFLFVCSARLFCPRLVEYPKAPGAADANTSLITGESRGEPPGYFALDPILRRGV